MPAWIEVSADYRCNNRCLGCQSVSDDGPSMSTAAVVDVLRRGRRSGARRLWLGGGEPTLRRDLTAIVSAGRALGYTTIKLQSNGMLLSYPDFTDRLVRAGLTEVNVSIKGARAETHDALTRTPGCHELLLRGIENVRRHRLPLWGDLLISRDNVGELAEMVRVYAGHGIERFNVWLLSAFDAPDPDIRAHLPHIGAVVAQVIAALEETPGAPADFITSLHTPPCTVPVAYHRCLFYAPDLDLEVVNPDGGSFMLQASPIEGGTYLPRCEGCAYRPRCDGLRPDYLERFGDGEFVPG